MDAADVIQTVLSVMQSGAATNASAAPPPPESAAGGAGVPLTLPHLLTLLVSTAEVGDWVKLLLVGAVIEGCRRALSKSWQTIVDFFWIDATFELKQDVGDWMMCWLHQRKVFHSARHVELSSYYFGFQRPLLDEDQDDNNDDTRKQGVSFMPAMSKTYSLWYKGRYMTVMREKTDEGPSWSRPTQVLRVRILSRNSRLLRDLVSEARAGHSEMKKNAINVFIPEEYEGWELIATQEKRPLSSVILDPGVMELVVNDAREFLHSRAWYTSRGIPFRRGYLLHGAPGAGKTSMIHSIASELGLSIYILSLTAAGLDDGKLKTLIAYVPEKSIVLIEDIDAALHSGMRRNIADPEKQRTGEGRPEKPSDDADDRSVNGVTLSGLLNALDGIAAQEGRILFATTNNYKALDPALCRPGRLDLHVEFLLASQYQAREIFTRFFSPDKAGIDSPASAAHECVDEKRDWGCNSAASAPPGDSPSSRPLLLDASAASPASAAKAERALPESIRSVYVGDIAGGAPRLSAEKVAALADEFASIVPPRTFSMATLQGYLMAYKIRPLDAVADAPAWVEKRMRERAEGEAAAKETRAAPTAVLGTEESK
ncbi:P-loop containing nucleoside triphosphate hydrolase protein [Trametes elegans]|nr:P-loop containing nucleoside triphosphate hydrolase protein [Trametes elegans]